MVKKSIPKLIWISCLDKERTIGSLVNAWGYSSNTSFYRGETTPINNLKDMGLVKENLKKGKSNREEKFYRSLFENYEKALEESEADKKDLELYKSDKEDINKFFNEVMREEGFFSLDRIKKLCDNDPDLAKKYGYGIPLVLLVQALTLDILVHKYVKRHFSKKLLLFGFQGAQGFTKQALPGLSFFDYFDDLFENKTEEEIRSLVPDYMKGTRIYNHCQKRIEKGSSEMLDALNSIFSQ